MLNPVFRKDMRVFFRNAKVYVGLTIYLAVLALITGSVLKMIDLNSYNGFNPEYVAGAYLGILGFQMVAITFVVPAFTSSSISGERERQTLDFMLITRMTGWDIVVGKLMSSIMLVCLMIVASMPVYSVIFYYGGISVIGFIFNTVFMIIYAAFVGSISLLFSTVIKKTAAATAITNLAILGISLGTFIATAAIIGIAEATSIKAAERFILGVICVLLIMLNPVVSFISIIDTQMGTDNMWSFFGEMLDINSLSPKYIQVWHIVAVLYILVSYLLLKLASKNIVPIKRVKRKKRIVPEKTVTAETAAPNENKEQ